MVFDKSEYINRLNKIKIEMQRNEIDVLITANPANMNYISGYDGYSFYVIQGVMILLNESEPIWIGRNMDCPGAQLTTWLNTENIKGYEDDYVQSDLKNPMHFFADVLKEKGITNESIGLELSQESLSVTSFMELQKKLPNCNFKNASYLVNRVRMVKSDAEIHYMKQAGKISVNAMNIAINRISDGVLESEVAAEIYKTLIQGTDEYTGDYPAIIPLMSAGKKISAPHLSWTNSQFKNDSIVTLELSGCVNRYHTPLARTIYLGTPSDQYKDIVSIVLEGLHEMLNVIKPGVTCNEVANSWNAVLEKSSIIKDSRVGYPIGIGYPPDWGEQTISMRPGDMNLLKENMTFHILPALFQAETGFVVSESIRVTENGCELLANIPNNLILK